jgi:hypothetical protein
MRDEHSTNLQWEHKFSHLLATKSRNSRFIFEDRPIWHSFTMKAPDGLEKMLIIGKVRMRIDFKRKESLLFEV